MGSLELWYQDLLLTIAGGLEGHAWLTQSGPRKLGLRKLQMVARLLVEAGGQMFLVPNQWRPDYGATLVVDLDDNIGIQYRRTG